jgi:hypothetical protein
MLAAMMLQQTSDGAMFGQVHMAWNSAMVASSHPPSGRNMDKMAIPMDKMVSELPQA